MGGFEAQDPDFAARIRASFERQKVMGLIGARLGAIEPGLVEIELDYRPDLTQQHGYLHAGISTIIGDSAAGYASYTLMPADSSILAIEFKVNLLAPARGQRFLARGRVIRPGRTVTASEFEVLAFDETGASKRCVFGLQTTMCLAETSDTPSRG